MKTFIHGGYLVPMAGPAQIVPDGALAIGGDAYDDPLGRHVRGVHAAGVSQ